MAEVPSMTIPSVATFSPGRTTKRSPTASSSTGTRSLDAVAEHRHVLGTELEQRLQGGARTALGPGLEVAPGEDEHGDPGRDLEVDLRTRRRRARRSHENAVGHADLAGRPEEQGVERPAEGGQHADAR